MYFNFLEGKTYIGKEGSTNNPIKLKCKKKIKGRADLIMQLPNGEETLFYGMCELVGKDYICHACSGDYEISVDANNVG